MKSTMPQQTPDSKIVPFERAPERFGTHGNHSLQTVHGATLALTVVQLHYPGANKPANRRALNDLNLQDKLDRVRGELAAARRLNRQLEVELAATKAELAKATEKVKQMRQEASAFALIGEVDNTRQWQQRAAIAGLRRPTHQVRVVITGQSFGITDEA